MTGKASGLDKLHELFDNELVGHAGCLYVIHQRLLASLPASAWHLALLCAKQMWNVLICRTDAVVKHEEGLASWTWAKEKKLQCCTRDGSAEVGF